MHRSATMRGIISLLPLTIPLLATPSHSFLPPPSPFLSTTTASTTRLLMASKKINHKIDPDSANVVHRESLELGEKKVYCRCWKSDTFPYCDGAHMMHNKATGDNVGPMIVVTAKLVEGSSTKEEERAVTIKEEESSTLGRKIKNYLGFDNRKVADGLTTRERLAKMGLSALLSYGWVSNMSYAVTLSLSWYGFSKKTGLSPLAPGQWKPFLAVYAGFYVFNNIIRPLRFGASVVVSKYFDNFVEFLQRKTNLSRKWSIAVVVFLANVLGTFTAMGLGISLASAAAGVPIFPPKP
ncbi:hypothetical protein ACHAW6_006607 [Cyclotella cf. meneghiniana]